MNDNKNNKNTPNTPNTANPVNNVGKETTPTEVKPEQPKPDVGSSVSTEPKTSTTPSATTEGKNSTETKRKRRSSADVRTEQKERLLEQISYYERAIESLKRKVEEIVNEEKREAILKQLQNRSLDELAQFANVNLSEI